MTYPDTTYFMGQGKCYLAPRVTNGAIKGPYTYVGDSSILQLTANQKFDDVEESTSGNRYVAAHIPIGLSYNAKMTNEQWSAANLARATYGSNPGLMAAGTVTAELVQAWAGVGDNGAQGNAIVPLANPGVSSVVAILGGASTTLASVTPNVVGTSALAAGTRVTAVPVGETATVSPTVVAVIGVGGGIDHYEVTNHGSGVSVPATSYTVAGVAAMTQHINVGAVALVLNTDYTVDANNGALVIKAGSLLINSGFQSDPTGTPISVNYSYLAYTASIESILNGNGISEYACRFQGFNTANGNSPVIVTLWRFSMNLAKTLDLITAKHGVLELDGMLLPDTTRNGTTQSQFYSIVKA